VLALNLRIGSLFANPALSLARNLRICARRTHGIRSTTQWLTNFDSHNLLPRRWRSDAFLQLAAKRQLKRPNAIAPRLCSRECSIAPKTSWSNFASWSCSSTLALARCAIRLRKAPQRHQNARRHVRCLPCAGVRLSAQRQTRRDREPAQGWP
jgi:hypothetical protein